MCFEIRIVFYCDLCLSILFVLVCLWCFYAVFSYVFTFWSALFGAYASILRLKGCVASINWFRVYFYVFSFVELREAFMAFVECGMV